jgi:nucleoside-diphosphate-sugar epimerase
MPGTTLITGAAGFVGSHLIDLLGVDGADLVAWFRPGGTAPGGTAPGGTAAGDAGGPGASAGPAVAPVPPAAF